MSVIQPSDLYQDLATVKTYIMILMTTGRAHESGICHQIEAEYKRLYVCRDGDIGASDVPCNSA